MFVRWKQRRLSNGDASISAVLVESVRIDGKPRQKVVKHLGTIRQSGLDARYETGIKARAQFWAKVADCLEALNCSVKEKDKIANQVHQRVPIVRKNQVEWYHIYCEWRRLGLIPHKKSSDHPEGAK